MPAPVITSGWRENPFAHPLLRKSFPATNGHGRRRLPSDLPRQKVIHDLPEDQKPCPCCGKMRHVIGPADPHRPKPINELDQFLPDRWTCRKISVVETAAASA